MSAFLCSPRHIGTLAGYAYRHQCHGLSSGLALPDDVAAMLAAENVRSVAYRYKHKPDATFDSVEQHAAFIQDCRNAAAHAEYEKLKPVEVLKLAKCLEYQSCEHLEWESSQARNILNNLIGQATRDLPGYEDAEWCLD